MKNFLRLITFPIILLLIFSSVILVTPVTAQADSLIIQTDGAIILIEGDNVLGVSTTDNTTPQSKSTSPAPASKPTSPPQPPTPTVTTPSEPALPSAQPSQVKTVSITTPNTSSVISTKPSPSNNNKIQVTIKTQLSTTLPTPIPSSLHNTLNKPSNNQSSTAPSAKPLVPASLSSSATSNPITSASPNPVTTSVINRDVDRVILEGQPNKPILTITATPNSSSNSNPNPSSNPNSSPSPRPLSTQNPMLIVQQGSTQISTSLPLQIDSSNHIVSVVLSTGPSKLNVLPSEAFQGVVNDKLVDNNTSVSSAPKVTLEENNKQPIYKVQGQKSGKLFGIFSVNSPVQVMLSAQSGNVVGINQSLIFNLFGLFIR